RRTALAPSARASAARALRAARRPPSSAARRPVRPFQDRQLTAIVKATREKTTWRDPAPCRHPGREWRHRRRRVPHLPHAFPVRCAVMSATRPRGGRESAATDALTPITYPDD